MNVSPSQGRESFTLSSQSSHSQAVYGNNTQLRVVSVGGGTLSTLTPKSFLAEEAWTTF